MYRRGDPRWNRTIQHISENLEHANETAAENLYGFTQSYVNPCLACVTRCCNAVTAPCFPSTSDRRRHRARSRGRAELSFDFYDDWDDDEGDGLLGWGHDSLERFLGTSSYGGGSYGSNYGTSYGTTQQPPAARPMAYAARARDPRFDARRKSTGAPHTAPDPTLIPSSSYFGFLARLPFNLGRKGLRYKPSAADLTEHPGARHAPEAQPLIEDSDEDPPRASASDPKTHRRARSNTLTSRHTTSSLSSRGDIFPSEDELDDAVPLDDEFAFVLERRGTGDESDAKTERSARSASLAGSARTSSDHRIETLAREAVPELAQLRGEEERVRREEEGEVRRRRARARDLAVRKGLAVEGDGEVDAKTDTTPGDAVLDVKSADTTTPGDAVLDAVLDEGRPGSPEERPVTAVRREAQIEGLRDGQKEDEGQGDAFVPARLPHFG